MFVTVVSSTDVVPIVVPIAVAFAVVAALMAWFIKYQDKKLSMRTRDVSMAPKERCIAVMFTDVQSSTKLWNTNKVAMEKAIHEHHHVIREIVAKYKGYEVKTSGDSFMVAHSDATPLLRMALEIHKKLMEVAWPAAILNCEDGCIVKNGSNVLFCGLRVRIGLHYGEANNVYDEVSKGFDYYGDTVNCTARVEAIAFGGQTLCTNAFLEKVDASLKAAGLSMTYMGPVELKGIAEPVKVTEVQETDLPRVFQGIRDEATTSVGTGNRINRVPLLTQNLQSNPQKDLSQMGLLEAREEIARLRSVIASLRDRGDSNRGVGEDEQSERVIMD